MKYSQAVPVLDGSICLQIIMANLSDRVAPNFQMIFIWVIFNSKCSLSLVWHEYGCFVFFWSVYFILLVSRENYMVHSNTP